MTFKPRFWRWTLLLAAAGLLVPAETMIRYFLFDGALGNLEVILWPSSILLMGLDGPTPRSASDIVIIYTILISENVLLYFVFGILTWFVAYLVRRLRSLSSNRPQSNSLR